MACYLMAPSHYLNQCWPIISEILWHSPESNNTEMFMKVVTSTHLKTTHLTYWGRVTHICVGKLTIIGSDNGLSPGRRQAIIWTNAGILLIGPLGTNFSEIYIEILTFSFKKMHFKVSSGKWWRFCLGLNMLKTKPHAKGTMSWWVSARYMYATPLMVRCIYCQTSSIRHPKP